MPRELNQRTDRLTQRAFMGDYNIMSSTLREVHYEPSWGFSFLYKHNSSRRAKKDLDLYQQYFINETLLVDKVEARKVQERTFNYTVVNGKLYMKSFNGPLLCCLTPKEVTKPMKEI